jgi:hypothetical protein
MNRLKLALALSALFASATGCFAETAQREVFLSATPDDLAKIIQDIGYRAEIAKNNAGKRFVRTRIGGKDVAILLFLCSDGEVCKSSTIGTYFTPAKKDDEAKSLRITNKFMSDRSFVRAYVDKDKDIVVETDIAFSGGITKDHYKVLLDAFEDHVKLMAEALKEKSEGAQPRLEASFGPRIVRWQERRDFPQRTISTP